MTNNNVPILLASLFLLVSPTSSTSTQSKRENPIAASSRNKADNDDLQYWFLSVLCLDSPSNVFAPTPARSAFTLYQRPAQESIQQQTCRSNGIWNSNHDQRDDVERYCDHEYPSIERTLSFDDWNDVDEYHPATSPPSPHVFRFDDWSSHGDDDDDDDDDDDLSSIFSSLPSDDLVPQCISQKKESGPYIYPRESTLVSTKQSNYYIHHSCSSTLAVVPPSDSYIFQPIREESNSSRLSVSITAAPTISIRSSIDPLSISEDEQHFSHEQDIAAPLCRGIPRVGSNDPEDDVYHPAILSVVQFDETSPCISSPTNPYIPPIPQVIFIPRQQKGWRRTILRSWNRVVSIGRTIETGTKKPFKKRFITKKGLRGEF